MLVGCGIALKPQISVSGPSASMRSGIATVGTDFGLASTLALASPSSLAVTLAAGLESCSALLFLAATACWSDVPGPLVASSCAVDSISSFEERAWGDLVFFWNIDSSNGASMSISIAGSALSPAGVTVGTSAVSTQKLLYSS
jgi:hypothetical protein